MTRSRQFDFATSAEEPHAAAIMRLRHLVVLIPTGLLAFVHAGFAAETYWLEPERFVVTPGAALTAMAMQGAEFGVDSSPVPASATTELTGQLAGMPLPITTQVVPPAALRFAATFQRPGVALLRAQLRSEPRVVAKEEVERYLRAMHADGSVTERWSEAGGGDWRETRVVTVKTAIRVGDSTDVWTTPSPEARGLDVVCESDPRVLTASAPFVVRIFRDGRPAAGAIVVFVSNGATREHVVVADDDGRAAATLGRQGRWLVVGTHIVPAAEGETAWRTEIATLSVEVR